ncbi:MAG: ankyrin repeat domain-containing protein [Rickettsiales bacterium]|jgi:ankyrin repeat protein|nr:ankyrin repeat domain-containing protein [Rickettsiales bacterium]
MLKEFFKAAREGKLEDMKVMVENGFDPHQASHDQRDALYYAITGGHIDVIEWLVIEQELDINHANIYGEIGLHVAAIERNYDVMRWMLEHGAMAEVGDNFGISPLQRAARVNVEMVDLLLSFGADINHVDNDGLTALHYSMLRGVDEDMMNHLVIRGADIYDLHGEVIFSQEYLEGSREYNVLHNIYILNQLPNYVESYINF